MKNRILNEFKQKYPKYKLIYLHEAGSTLYGTTLPTSDIDFRGIYIPDMESLLTKTDNEHFSINDKPNNQKNDVGDLDCSFWSIHKFLRILKNGDTNAFDTLFSFDSPSNLYSTKEMKILFDNKNKLFPNNLNSFFGYAQSQVKKYSIKGNRLHIVLQIKEFLKTLEVDKTQTIETISTKLPINDNCFIITLENKQYYEILGRKFIFNMSISEFETKVDKIISSYGERAKTTMNSNNIDYKAVGHAFRVIWECEELMTTEKITFPLRKKQEILKIRKKQYGFELFEMLENEFDRVEIIEKSNKNLLKNHKGTINDVNSLLLQILNESFNLKKDINQIHFSNNMNS